MRRVDAQAPRRTWHVQKHTSTRSASANLCILRARAVAASARREQHNTGNQQTRRCCTLEAKRPEKS
eukprot:15452640-Alexandrium_andersonii.AAC.1